MWKRLLLTLNNSSLGAGSTTFILAGSRVFTPLAVKECLAIFNLGNARNSSDAGVRTAVVN